ncbi:histidine ammonia-lyase [Roseivirga sp. UBA1976]|uniref:histidine ammonia-lyase n=1 Tax=Roseivirga sp. UBA1976 TaxID=1947386 RepID=UPI00257C27BC|nr:histidine ammonia-lyase [Roseivirga sp. UBA1976]|tara:strand:+ start:7335 stop:8891 length:1557 start_codon:yes stop_codon:yes gene_type:complete
MKHFNYGIDFLTVGKALQIAKGEIKGTLSASSIEQVEKSAQAVEDIVSGERTVYGINTGFGPLCTTKISAKDTRELQYNILKSHSVGVGKPIDPTIAQLMLILKAHSLAQGFSGIQLSTIERIIWHIDNQAIPVVPEQGSVGASGDLAPLAHLFLPLIGLGEVYFKGERMSTERLFQITGLQPVALGPKEGLALINGTQFIAAHAVMVVDRLYNCLSHADIIGAMMIEALMGSAKPFSPRLHEIRPFKGNRHVAHRIRVLLEGSEILNAHINCGRVQDPYSLRCIPQVHGSSRNAWLHLKELLEVELNAVTDNPIILSAEETISGGNFHGQPMALPLDYAALAAAEIGNISDRRIYLSLEGKVEGLPQLLMNDTGINSGFMLPQYTSAALVSENKSLCFPASADSIPTSLGQEDHVSMGSISGRKALQIIGNLEQILAIELLCAAQAFDFRRPLRSGPALEACHAYVRTKIDHADKDRIFADDIQKAHTIITERKLIALTQSEMAQKESPFHVEFENY